MATGHKENGKFHPHNSGKGRVSEKDMNISQKGNNDTIIVEPTNGVKNKHDKKIIYKGKHTLLSKELANEKQRDMGSAIFDNLNPNEKITYVVSKSDKDGHLYYHWEDGNHRSIAWYGNQADWVPEELARRTSAIAFRTDYRNGIQYNLPPEEFEGFRWDK